MPHNHRDRPVSASLLLGLKTRGIDITFENSVFISTTPETIRKAFLIVKK